MKYKLLALDLDGTLTNTKKEITPYTRRTIIKAQQKGVKIILATVPLMGWLLLPNIFV